MHIQAAVTREKGGKFHLETLSLEAPRAEELLVRITAVGVCHTDLAMRDQVFPVPQPVVLGMRGRVLWSRWGRVSPASRWATRW